MDKTRIKLISKSNPDYRKYKKYWKLLLKNEDELDDTKKSYSKNFEYKLKEHGKLIINKNAVNKIFNIFT